MTERKARDYEFAIRMTRDKKKLKIFNPYYKLARALTILIDEYDLYYDGVDTQYYCKNMEASKYLTNLLERRVELKHDDKEGWVVMFHGITEEMEDALIKKAQQVINKRRERYSSQAQADIEKINNLL